MLTWGNNHQRLSEPPTVTYPPTHPHSHHPPTQPHNIHSFNLIEILEHRITKSHSTKSHQNIVQLVSIAMYTISFFICMKFTDNSSTRAYAGLAATHSRPVKVDINRYSRPIMTRLGTPLTVSTNQCCIESILRVSLLLLVIIMAPKCTTG